MSKLQKDLLEKKIRKLQIEDCNNKEKENSVDSYTKIKKYCDTNKNMTFEILYYLYFEDLILHHPQDNDLLLWIGIYESDHKKVNSALMNGAHIDITRQELYNRYCNESVKNYKDKDKVYNSWRHLYLMLAYSNKII
jgi:hypothetical protein